jgi:hypothetical protein
MDQTTKPSAPRLAAFLGATGLIVLAITLTFGRLPAVQAAGECWTSDAVFLFEFATSQDDLRSIFGAESSRCRALTLTAMDAANTLDVFAYIPAYTAFTCLAALYVAGATHRLRALAIGLALAAAIADYVETTTLLAITPDLEAAARGQMLVASTAAWIKFGSLAAHAAVLSVACFIGAPRRPVLAAVLALPLIGFASMALRFEWHTLLKLGFFAGWTSLLIVGAWDALRSRFSSAPQT